MWSTVSGLHLALSLFAIGLSAAQQDIFQYIDPLIGSSDGGHVFSGATLPFGMAKAVGDVMGENQGGYNSDNYPIMGFSHMHDSGTGGSPSLGNFPIWPQPPCPSDDLNECKWSQADRAASAINGTVEAHPGYFALTLNTSIKAEMTVTNHTALYRFTFLPNMTTGTGNSSNAPVILAELMDLPQSRTNATANVDPETGRMTGSGTFAPSFGIGTYDLHFCADFSGSQVRDTGVFMNIRAGNEPKNVTVYADGVDSAESLLPAGTFARFQDTGDDGTIIARVGVSFISPEEACHNAETEIPDFDFDGTLKTAEDSWREKLSVIEVDAGGASDEIQAVFWSGVYRSMISPQDYTGENPLWESDEPYYDSFYCIWDSFRSIHTFILLFDPESQARMIRSLIDIYRHEGKLPDCRMSLCKGFTQGGSNADIVLVESFLKNLTMGIDWDTAYEALISDAEVEPPIWSVEGRGGLKSWKELHYIPTDDYDPYGVGPNTRSISRTVEYAYDDFCIAEMAHVLGKDSDAEKYFDRSTYWKNMYNPDQTSFINETDTGFVGFLQPKYLNQTWGYQDPIFCSPLLNFTSCYLNPDGHETYEGSCWLYTFFVPGDMANLILTLGGPEAFVNRLNYFHEFPDLLYFGDEQAFLNVFLYHYAGRPGLSASRAHSYIPSQFNTTLVGIPGNDDSGAMGSFAALTMLGIFPNPGQDVYFITPPFLEEVKILNKQTGKTATIRNVNFDPGYEAIYVQSATVDGENYGRNWLDHSFFLEGKTLELTLGRNESSSWGTGKDDLPPSLSTTGPFYGEMMRMDGGSEGGYRM